MAISLAALLGVLTGCGKRAEDTRRLENPPPKPPNCQDLPELKNIMLKDGTIADVRIVQFRGTKMYIPAELMKRTFIENRLRNPAGFIAESSLQQFNPDIHENECAGVLHKVRLDIHYASKGFMLAIGLKDEKSYNISPDSLIKDIGLFYWKNTYAEEAYGSPGGGYESGSVKIFPDVYANYNISQEGAVRPEIGSPEWVDRRESVKEFLRWLTTPPRERDNKRMFNLGAKQSSSGDTILISSSSDLSRLDL